VTLEVSDGDDTVSDTLTVVVANLDPTITSLTGDSQVEEGVAASFTASATTPGTDSLTYAWDFGDSSGGSGASPSHSYVDEGVYTVTLTVTDEGVGQSVDYLTVTVSNAAPVITLASGDETAQEGPGGQANFTGSADDAGDDTLTYTWHFGDGSSPQDGQSVSHTYADSGSFTASLVVSDGDGGVAIQETAVTVVDNLPPTSSLSNDGPVYEGSPVSVSFVDSYDPSEIDAESLLYSFDFNNDGDFDDPGDVLDGESLSAPVPAEYLGDGSSTLTVRGRVSDKDGGFTDYTTDVVIFPAAPEVFFDQSGPIFADPGQTVDLTGGFTDPGDDAWTAQVDYDYDPQAPNWQPLTLAGQTFSISHAYPLAAAYDLAVKVTDTDDGVSDIGVIRINVGTSSQVEARLVFYNNSSADGNDPLANASDDNAIAADKQVLLPGQTATAANYSSYARGVNGIMVDISGLPAALTSDDFITRINQASDPDTWTPGPEPTVSVRYGDGVDGADRITLIWPDGAIRNQWVEVTVKANGNTGLAEDDVFYFGNAAGDSDGDGVIGDSDYNAFTSQFGLRGSDLSADVDGDGKVGLADFAAMRSGFGTTVLAPTPPAPAPAGAPAAMVDDMPPTGAYSDQSIAVGGLTIPATLGLPADMLVEAPALGRYAPIIAPATQTPLAATTEHELQALSDDLLGEGVSDVSGDLLDIEFDGDLLPDLLAESVAKTPM